MRSLSFLLILSLFTFGCKSTKKAKSSAMSATLMSSAVTSVDSSSVSEKEQVQEIEEETITETVEQSHAAFDSAGITVLKPVVKSTTVTTSIKKKDSTKTKESVTVDSLQDLKSEESNAEDKDLDKESDGMDPIESVATALFPTWGKILASILVAVVPVLWGFFTKKKTNPTDGIPPTRSEDEFL